MSTGTTWRCQTPIPFAAPADSDRQATVGNYIKRMLLVSDNLAYNRLYEFLGQKPLNDRLQQLGYPGSRIVRRFAPCDTAANRHTNPIAFHTLAGDTLYNQPAQTNTHTPAPPLGPVFAGHAYQVGRRLIRQPYEFTTANNLPLPDITAFLQTALFPESLPAAQRPTLTPPDYAFLRLAAPYEPRPGGFERNYHSGSLEYNATEKARQAAIFAAVPTVVDIYLDRRRRCRRLQRMRRRSW
jgi:hypothetical protein